MGRFERRWRARSRRHWAILIACLGLVVLGVWIALGEPVKARVVLSPPWKAPRMKPAAPAVAAAAVMPQTLVPPPLRGGGAEQIEVCGLGWVEVHADGKIDPVVVDRLPGLEAAGRRVLSSLASSGDEFDRAAAWWLQMLEPSLDGTRAAEPPSGCEREACAIGAEERTKSDSFLERLALAATTSRDPRVYGLAFRACRNRGTGSCSLLSARRWAQLDVDNGDPWIYVMDEASTRKDEAQVEEAIFHVGAASRVDMRYFAVPRAIVQHAPTDEASLQAANVLTIVSIGGMAALPLPALQIISRACQAPALGDANRRQRCDAAASALAERSDTLLYSLVGARIGSRLGWSEARTDAIRSWGAAAAESQPVGESDPRLWSCARIAKMLERVSRQGVIGETGFAREWIVAGGTTLERYAAREAEQRRRVAEVASAASSPARIAASVSGDVAASSPAR